MNDVRITYYDELVDVFQLTTLYYLSLNWPATPEILQQIRQNDDRYTPEFGMFAVTRDNIVIGGVLLMEIPTKTLNGKSLVGALNAVATRPGYERRGVMTTLITRCHEFFAEHNIEYVFLTTYRSLGAHNMYKKIGYKDLTTREISWKQVGKAPRYRDKTIVVTNFQEHNTFDVNRIFKVATRDSYGFVYRPRNFLKARYDGKLVPSEKMRLAKRNNEVTGYAYWESSPEACICPEILALDQSSFASLLADAENRFHQKFLIVHCGGLSKREASWLRLAHYNTEIQTYGTIMVKTLREHASLQSIRSIFGVDKGLFRMGIWDST